jgi:hypothetical protein
VFQAFPTRFQPHPDGVCSNPLIPPGSAVTPTPSRLRGWGPGFDPATQAGQFGSSCRAADLEAIMNAESRRRYEPAYFLDQIAEYIERGVSPVRARAEAYRRLRNAWLNRNSPPRTPSSTCVHCGSGVRLGDPMLPSGVDPAVVWVHHDCREGWWLARQAQAAAALASVGVEP